MHHVIVGSGPAGVTAAETIRSICKNSKITMIGGEGKPPYSRMAIPYLLHGDIQEKGTYLRQTAGHYDSLGIDYKQARIAGIDATKKQLWTSNIEPIAYDKLLLATGATPIIPRMEGADLPGVHTCWTLSDARAITKLVGKGTPVVLVGAGFIGSIVLEALHKTFHAPVFFRQRGHFNRVIHDESRLDQVVFHFFTENFIDEFSFPHRFINLDMQLFTNLAQSVFIHF